MRAATAFTAFKAGLYGLLAFNIVLFFRHATFHEGIDCIGWFVLLMLFEWETRRGPLEKLRRPERWHLVGQAMAYGLILYAWGNYWWHREWLDALNATLWLGVVGMIELDLFQRRRHAAWHQGVRIGLYAGLLLIAVVWGITSAWLDFYDAALWIVCFFAIELNLLGKWARR